MIMKKLAAYALAGALALGVSCKGDEHEIKSVSGKKGRLNQVVGNAEISLEDTIKRMYSCKPENYDFALKHVYIPGIHEKISRSELTRTLQRLAEDYKDIFASGRDKSHKGKSFLLKWDGVVTSVDLRRIGPVVSCYSRAVGEKYGIKLRFKEIEEDRVVTAESLRRSYKAEIEKLRKERRGPLQSWEKRKWKLWSKVPAERRIHKVKINVEITEEGKTSPWKDTLYFTKINRQWLYVDD